MYVAQVMAFRGERYETLRVIASGGMATVHLGRALGAGGFERLVAIKVMHSHLASEPEFIAMFLDEARLAARIRHPNVVSTLDVQNDQEGAFLVMDYIEGPSLKQVMQVRRKSGEPIPIDILLRIFLDTLAGLHAAHELRDGAGNSLNLVHRDVSPHNILIGVDGIARITDFGVARAEARIASTHSGQLKGKIAYMSPEQARAEPVDRRADIYAAGVILWEMLTNRALIRGSSDIVMLGMVAAADHPPPRSSNASVPEALSAACARALRRLPSERFATAADFGDAIELAAFAADVRIATPRALAAFIRELNLHATPLDLPALPPSSSTQITPFSSRSPSLGSPAIPARDSSQPQTMAAIAVQQEPSDASRSSSSSSNLSRVSSKVEGRRSLGWLLAGAGAFTIAGAAAAVFTLRPDALRGYVSAEPDSADRAASSATPTPAPAQGTIVEPAPEALAAGQEGVLPGDPGSASSSGDAGPGAPDASTDAQAPLIDSGIGDAGAVDAQAPSAPAPTGPYQRRPVQGPSGGKPGKDPVYRPPNL
jgi:serine/threonine-protein kinase